MPSMNKQMFDERVCPICGKTFFRPPATIYKYREGNKIKYACSYSCWMKKRRELGLE